MWRLVKNELGGQSRKPQAPSLKSQTNLNRQTPKRHASELMRHKGSERFSVGFCPRLRSPGPSGRCPQRWGTTARGLAAAAHSK